MRNRYAKNEDSQQVGAGSLLIPTTLQQCRTQAVLLIAEGLERHRGGFENTGQQGFLHGYGGVLPGQPQILRQTIPPARCRIRCQPTRVEHPRREPVRV